MVGMRRAAMYGLRERAKNLFHNRLEDILEEQDELGIAEVDQVRFNP